MKKSFFIFSSTLFLFLTGGFVSCSGGGDTPDQPTGPVVLKVNKTEITANGIDQAVFEVTRGTSELTKEAEIWQIGNGKEEKLATPKFSTKTAGTYKFEARYTTNGETLVSEPVTITSTEAPKEVFYHRIFTQQFTSTNCKYCPQMTSVLEGMAQTPEWGDRMVHATFHKDFDGPDPMHLDISEEYYRQFKLAGLPACILDMIPSTKVQIGQKDLIEAQMNKVLADYPAMCGVAVESTYDSNTRKVDITVKVKATQTNEYRIIGFLLEDGIISPQNSNPLYKHNNTVRAALSTSLNGEKLGTINADSEVTKTFSATIDNAWKAEKMQIAICVLNKVNDTFYGNNSAMCPLGGSINYKYNEE